MSRIIIMHETGGPDVLRLEHRPTPRPGADQVLIRVHAIGLNRADTMVRTGAYPLHPLPASLGFEAAGIVKQLGEGVGGLAIGDRVAILPDASLGYTTYGEHSLVPARLVVPIASGMAFEAASALWGTALTAYHALVERAALSVGDHVLISAASSGVGISAIQIARQLGAVPIALTRDASKDKCLGQAGAAHIIRATENIAEGVRSITQGKGARVIFDLVGGALFADLVGAAAIGGIVLLNGALGGSTAHVSVSDVMVRRLSLRGCVLAELLEDSAALGRARAFVDRAVAARTLNPIVAATFPIERMADAHRYLESDQQVGKVVVTVD